MSYSQELINELRASNQRITKTRKAVLALLEKSKKPLSSPEILSRINKLGLSINKTTIYRELDFLKKQEIVKELQLGDNAKYYELTPKDHHHHLICVSCDEIEDVVLEKDLDLHEKAITKNKKFKILNHSLEFYGICKSCQ